MRVDKGTRFRVLQPFKSSDLKPCGPSAWTGDPYTFQPGEELEYLDLVPGWGSDPAFDTLVRAGDGFNHRIMSGWGVSHYLDPEKGFVEAI